MTRQIAKVLTGSMIAGAALAVHGRLAGQGAIRIIREGTPLAWTELRIGDWGIQTKGTGPEVERDLREAARERGRHG